MSLLYSCLAHLVRDSHRKKIPSDRDGRTIFRIIDGYGYTTGSEFCNGISGISGCSVDLRILRHLHDVGTGELRRKERNVVIGSSGTT